LALLTKPDVFLALAAAFVCASALFLLAGGGGKLLCRSLALMAGAGLVPAAGFFLLFFSVEDFRPSLGSVFAAWIPLLTTSAADNSFFRWGMGMDAPWVHLREMFLEFLGLAALVAACALPCWRKIPKRTAFILAAGLAAGLIEVSRQWNWSQCGQCLPLVCLTLLGLLAWRGFRSGWEPPVVFPFLWTFWSLALTAKLGLFCRIWHYGFALAMPAFVSGVYFLLWALPRQVERCGGARTFLFQGLLWLMLLPGLARLTQDSLTLYAHKTMPVGSGGDTILAFDPHFRQKDADVAAALSWVEINVPARATLAVLPQGALLNYLSRHDNPCGYDLWNPPEMAAFGQEKMTRAFIEHSPDYVIELFINYGEYGEAVFGLQKRFGLDVQQWIDAHYQPAALIGHDWLKDGQFGIKIFKKKPSGPASGSS
jgi:hypothetical protein